jgi:hypothetical protein
MVRVSDSTRGCEGTAWYLWAGYLKIHSHNTCIVISRLLAAPLTSVKKYIPNVNSIVLKCAQMTSFNMIRQKQSPKTMSENVCDTSPWRRQVNQCWALPLVAPTMSNHISTWCHIGKTGSLSFTSWPVLPLCAYSYCALHTTAGWLLLKCDGALDWTVRPDKDMETYSTNSCLKWTSWSTKYNFKPFA